MRLAFGLGLVGLVMTAACASTSTEDVASGDSDFVQKPSGEIACIAHTALPASGNQVKKGDCVRLHDGTFGKCLADDSSVEGVDWSTYARTGTELGCGICWADVKGVSRPVSCDPDVMPTTIGDCSETTITSITGRVTPEPNETGTAVSFANGGHQVSYDKVDAIIRSKVGDKVRTCLDSLPKDCPPGDDRGKVYTTTNERTNESWTMQDSQHGCGGA